MYGKGSELRVMILTSTCRVEQGGLCAEEIGFNIICHLVLSISLISSMFHLVARWPALLSSIFHYNHLEMRLQFCRKASNES
jgi:hypothetical protein